MLRFRRQVAGLLSWIVLSLTVSCLQGWAACDRVPAGQTLRVRLSQPVSSYSAKPGMPLLGILIESPECDGLPLFPQGTAVEGRVQSVRKVGMGFRHETAALELEFDLISPDDSPPITMHARVLNVDNARESVKNGVIHGIRSTATPQNRFIFPLAHLLVWTPYSYWIPAASAAMFPISSEPEIYFPVGTDLRLELTAPLPVATSISPALANGGFEESGAEAFNRMVLSFTQRTSNEEGRAADVVNLLLIGSREKVERAFLAARWTHSDPLSVRSVLRGFHAVISLNSDPHLPMSSHLLDGKSSDSTWQKSLDSYSKRDHVRIWDRPETWEGQTTWLAASTAEEGASWSFRRARFVHHVVPDIDEEREKIVRDLSIAGCVEAAYNSPRPTMPASMVGSTGTELRTDGAVAVVQLRECQSAVEESAGTAFAIATRPRSKFVRIIRAQVLSLRNLWRENIVYDGVDMGRTAVGAIRTSRANNRVLKATMQSSSTNVQ
jgi:hypothetical protein